METTSYFIGPSKIHGKGIIARGNLDTNHDVGVGIGYYFGIWPYVTPSPGSMINHSYTPNCYLKWSDEDYGWHIITSEPIKKNTELTVNYNNTPWYIQKPLPHYK